MKDDSPLRRILTSNWFIHICVYVPVIVVIQHWIFDYPNRLSDYFGTPVIIIISLVYFYGFGHFLNDIRKFVKIQVKIHVIVFIIFSVLTMVSDWFQ